MKITLLSISIVLSLTAISFGQAPAKARDPWDGFAVGSWAIVHSRSDVEGKLRDEMEEHLTLETINSAGSISLHLVQKVRGRIIDTTRSIYANRVLAVMGFQLESQKDAALKIGDRELAVTVKTWIAEKEAEAQAALRKHFVQFLTLPKDSLEFELVSYEPAIDFHIAKASLPA